MVIPETVSEGWKANRGHYAADFVSPDELTVLTKVESPCSSTHTPLILIIVCSALGNREQRQAIRETWGGRAEENNLRVLFLTGRSHDRYSNVSFI